MNENKIQYKKQEIRFLGQIVNGETVKIPSDKIKKVSEWKRPQNKKELEKFLGLINHHKNYIKNFTGLTANLYDLLKETKSIENWTDAHEKNFDDCKKEVEKNVPRYLPDMNKNFILECDASNIGIAAILKQKGDEGKERTILPFSRKLTKNEKNWTITEKELFAIIEGLKRFKEYLNGKTINIISDHKALQWLQTKDNFGNPRIQRWMEGIEGIDFVIEYRKGSEIGKVDDLSRNFEVEEEKDEKLEKKQKNIIKIIHEKLAHRGVTPTLYSVQKDFTKWPKQKAQVQEIIENCETCARNKVKTKGGCEFVETSRRLELFGIDILESGEEYYSIGIDYFTRNVIGDRMQNKNGETIVRKLKNWFEKIGNPEMIITDQGNEFKAGCIKNYLEIENIKHHRTSIEHSEGNGRVERLFRTVRDAIRKRMKKKVTNEEMQQIITNYNNTYHSAIEMTPAEAWICQNEKLKEANKKTNKYAQKFKKKCREKFIKSQIVAVQQFPRRKENTRSGLTGKLKKNCKMITI